MTDMGVVLRLYDSWNASYQPSLFMFAPAPGSAPQIDSLQPASIASGVETMITAIGSGFEPTSVVEVHTEPAVTTFIDETRLTFPYRPPRLPSVEVVIRNGETMSNIQTLTIGGPAALALEGRTVDDLKALVIERPEMRDQVVHFERSGKGRKRLLDWLHNLGPVTEPVSPPVPATEPVPPAPGPEPEPPSDPGPEVDPVEEPEPEADPVPDPGPDADPQPGPEPAPEPGPKAEPGSGPGPAPEPEPGP